MQGGRITFSGQVQNYQNTVSQIVELLGDEDSAANYLSKCIYSIGLGSNDYLNNYFMPQFYSSSRQFSTEDYADNLIQAYTQNLRVSLKLSFPLTIIKWYSIMHIQFSIPSLTVLLL